MKKFNVKENLQVVVSEKFKKDIRFAVESTYNGRNEYGVTMYDKQFIATVVTFNPTNQEVECFSSRHYVDTTNTVAVDKAIQESINNISNSQEYSQNELIAVIKASEFEYHVDTGYPSKEEREVRNLKLENKYMSLYIDIVSRANESKNDIPIEELNLSLRSYNCLKRADYNTIGEIKNASLDDMMKVRNLGYTSLSEIEEVLNIKFA